MRRRLQYANNPDPKPKSSVINAVPIATEGSSLSTMINSGEKNTAPPIPLAMATVTMAMAAGNRNQYSVLSGIDWSEEVTGWRARRVASRAHQPVRRQMVSSSLPPGSSR